MKSPCTGKSSQLQQRFNVWRALDKMLPWDDGTRKYNLRSNFRQPAYDKLRLLRSRRRSSASSCAIPSRKPSISSWWLRANHARLAAVSAMKAVASSGPPSKPGSSLRGRRSLPEDARLRRLRAFFKQIPFSRNRLAPKLLEYRVLAQDTPFESATLGGYSTTFQIGSDGYFGRLQHLSI